jgi:MoxR-like ATPase
MNQLFEKLDAALAAATPLTLTPVRNWPETAHVLDADSVWAVKMALATGRPLLLRGEPGAGKSQLARAAAQVLEWPFLSRVVNARFEPEDLLYRFDAVARLARAQVLERTPEAMALLDPKLFLLPEVLWWALDHTTAAQRFGKAKDHCGETGCEYGKETGFPFDASKGVVVLIDEIDKADSEVPNSLLETLSIGGFQLPYGGETVKASGVPPLIIITTNEDRELPVAFLRRCLVHHMDLPKNEPDFTNHLKARAAAHFPAGALHDAILTEAITQLKKDRDEAARQDLPKAGQAELLDLLKAVATFGTDEPSQRAALERLRPYAFSKNRPGP